MKTIAQFIVSLLLIICFSIAIGAFCGLMSGFVALGYRLVAGS